MHTNPLVSVVVPAYFSHDTIGACLRALEAQTFRNFETIVVNSSPEEQTQSVVRSQFPGVVFVQSPVRLLPHAARNKGAELARGRLIVFTDPDCIADLDWLEKLVRASEEGHSVVGGGMGIINRNWLETGIHLQKFYWCLDGSPAGYLPEVATANACYTRDVWDRIGPFQPDIFCGDTVLAWRAGANSIRIRFVPDAVVKHDHDTTPRKFLKERFFRGREFTVARTTFHRWSRIRSLLYLLATPLNLIAMLLKAGTHSFTGGYGKEFLLTFPLQVAGHSAWLCGEAVAHANRTFSTR